MPFLVNFGRLFIPMPWRWTFKSGSIKYQSLIAKQMYHSERQRRTKPSDIRIRTKFNTKSNSTTPFGKYVRQISKYYKTEYTPSKGLSADSRDKLIGSNLVDNITSESNHFYLNPNEKSSQHVAMSNKNSRFLTGEIMKEEAHESQLAPNDILSFSNDPTEALAYFKRSLAYSKEKNFMHKSLWICLKRRQWEKWDHLIKSFKASEFQHDEISYTIMLHGLILSPRHDISEAFQVLHDMKKARIDPAIIYLNETLLEFYSSLHDFDITIKDKRWRSALRSSWLIAVLIRNRREKFLSRLIESTAREQF